VPGLVICSASSWQSRQLHRLGCCSAAQPYPFHRVQHALPDPAVGASRASGVAYPWPDGVGTDKYDETAAAMIAQLNTAPEPRSTGWNNWKAS